MNILYNMENKKAILFDGYNNNYAIFDVIDGDYDYLLSFETKVGFVPSAPITILLMRTHIFRLQTQKFHR